MKTIRSCLLLALLACSGEKATQAPPKTAAPVAAAETAAPVDPLAEPPPAGITPSLPFPSIIHRRLESGLALAIVPRRSFPTVELRLVVMSGQASDDEKPGLANLTGKLLKDGGAGRYTSRELAERAEGLGAKLSISTDRDATRIGLGVTTSAFDEALGILATVALEPRFSAVEFQKLRQREIDRVKDRVRTSPSWLGSMLLYRELYELPVSVHPYARYDALPEELAAITLADAKAWHRTHFTAENAVLVVCGDVDADAVEAAAKKRFQAFRGPKPAPPNFSDAPGPNSLQLFVVDRPGSAQSQIYAGTLGPERKSDAYPALMTANQILGGGVSGRLFLDVREKRSLAYNTSSWMEEPARGPMPIVLSAGTQTAKTADAVAALIEHFDRIGSQTPSAEEVERAARFLSDSFLFKLETAGAIADLSSRLPVLGLPDDAYDDYRRAVRKLEPNAVSAAAGRYFRKGALIVVVAGDAATIAKPLARFGAVSVVDPEKGFVISRTVPRE
jgi:zinc protease